MKRILIILILIPTLLVGQTKNELLGKIDATKHANFTKTEDYYMLKEVSEAYLRMKNDAKKDRVNLFLVSAFRSFDAQKRIWERKWNDNTRKSMSATQRAQSILEYSSMPTTSRHHWGTDLDFNNLNTNYFYNDKDGVAIYKWLKKNAHKYGFFQPYTPNRETGYKEEPWHWSYYPISDKFMYLYNETITYKDINGFLGSEQAEVVDVIKNWVNGVAKSNKAATKTKQ